MKRTFIYLIALLATLLAFQGCSCGEQKAKEFVLTASELPSEVEGKSLFIINTAKEVIAELTITDGAFSYTAPEDLENLYSIAIKQGRSMAVRVQDFVMEGRGELYVYDIEPTLMEPDITIAYDIRWEEGTSPLNEALASIRSDLEKEVEPLEREALQIGYTMIRERENEELVEELRAQHSQLLLEGKTKKEEVVSRYTPHHTDDAVAIELFNIIGYTDEADLVDRLEAAPAVVQNDPHLKKRYEESLLIVATSAGKPYTDFLMDDGEGQQARLSDYMEEGQYLLVDFWASWCGPCRKGMPLLAELHEKYGDKGLRILSIGISEEKKENNDKAAAELGITWNRFYDASGVSSDTYGVITIPELILIAPDGTILLRDSSARDVESVLLAHQGK